MVFIVVWLFFGALTAIVASSKGRSGFGWLLLGLVFGIFALILVAILPNLTKREVQKARREVKKLHRIFSQTTRDVQTGTVSQTTTIEQERLKELESAEKQCRECAELVKKEARICRFCGYEFWSQEEQERRDAEAAERRKGAIEKAARALGVEQELAEELYRSAEKIPRAGWIEEAQKHIRWAQHVRKDFPHKVSGYLSQAYILAEDDERLRSEILGQYRAISRRPRRASKTLLTVGTLLILLAVGLFGAERKGLIKLSSIKEITSLEGASSFLTVAKDKLMKLLPTPPYKKALVVKVGANVRSGPGKQHPVKAVLPKGTNIVEKEVQGDWVQFKRGETAGWIHRSLVVTELEWKKLREEERQRVIQLQEKREDEKEERGPTEPGGAGPSKVFLRCSIHRATGTMLIPTMFVLCPPHLDEVDWGAVGKVACSGLSACNAWIWNEPRMAPKPPYRMPMTDEEVRAAVGVWVNARRRLSICSIGEC